MTGLSAYKANTRTAKEYIEDILLARRVAFLQASPGVGRSSIVRQIAQEYNLKLIDHRLSTSAPEDLSGLPEFRTNEKGERYATFSPFDIFPVAGTELPAHPGQENVPEAEKTRYSGWLVFLDEFNSASKSVQAAAYKLILDRQVGQHDLHPSVAMVAAGNLATDRALVNALSTAMQSRVIHIEMEVDFQLWLQDVAIPQGYDDRIIAYLSFKSDKLLDFKPDHNEKTFCCPRTWEFMNDLIKGKPFTKTVDSAGNDVFPMDKKVCLYAGTITSGVALDFVNFTKVFASLPSITTILADPEGVPVGSDPGINYAIVTFLMGKVTDANFEKIAIYINRFRSEFRVLFYRGLIIRQPALRKHPVFAQALLELSRYFHD